MSDDEKLSRPSFEPMAAGVSIGSEEFAFTADDDDWLEVEAIEFETLIMNKEKKEPRRSDPENLYQLSAELFGKQARFGAAGGSGDSAQRQGQISHEWWASIGLPKKVGASWPPMT